MKENTQKKKRANTHKAGTIVLSVLLSLLMGFGGYFGTRLLLPEQDQHGPAAGQPDGTDGASPVIHVPAAAFVPVELTGDTAIQVIQDLVSLNYFTPSPFYISQSDTAYNSLLMQRESETLALAEDLMSLVRRLEADYIETAHLFAAVISDVSDTYSGDEPDIREYFDLVVGLEWDLNLVTFNTHGYGESFDDWARVANGVDSPFRVSQAKHFQMLLAMMAGYEISGGFEMISVRAREFLQNYSGISSNEAALRSALDGIAGKSGEVAEAVAMTTAIYKSIVSAIRGNQAQALAALGEKIVAQSLAMQRGGASPDAQMLLDMDKLMYAALKAEFEENAPAEAVPWHIRPLTATADEAQVFSLNAVGEDAHIVPSNGITAEISAALEAISVTPMEFAQADRPALEQAYAQYLSGAYTFDKPIDAVVPSEEIVAAYRVTFDQYIEDHERMREAVTREEGEDGEEGANSLEDIVRDAASNLRGEEHRGTVLLCSDGDMQEHRGTVLLCSDDDMHDTETNVNTGEPPPCVPATLPLAAEPLAERPQAPAVKRGAGYQIYIGGVAINNLRCSSIINLISAATDLYSAPAGSQLIGTTCFGMVAQHSSKIYDLDSDDIVQRMEDLLEREFEDALNSLMNWIESVAMTSPTGLGLGLFNIDIVLDISDEFDPNPPTDFGYSTGAFEALLQNLNGILTPEELQHIAWEGTATLVRTWTEDYEALITGITNSPLDQSFLDAGITQGTRELSVAYYQAALEAVSAGFYTTARLEFSGKPDDRDPDNPYTFSYGHDYKEFDVSHMVYMEQIRSSVTVSYAIRSKSYSDRALMYNPAGYYYITGNHGSSLEFIPRIDPETGEALLTGLEYDFSIFGGAFWHYTLELEMSGKLTEAQMTVETEIPGYICRFPPPPEKDREKVPCGCTDGCSGYCTECTCWKRCGCSEDCLQCTGMCRDCKCVHDDDDLGCGCPGDCPECAGNCSDCTCGAGPGCGCPAECPECAGACAECRCGGSDGPGGDGPGRGGRGGSSNDPGCGCSDECLECAGNCDECECGDAVVPDRPARERERLYPGILITGEWAGTATLRSPSQRRWRSGYNRYDAEVTPWEYRYYQDMRSWLGEDDGEGVVRDVTLSLGRRDASSTFTVAETPAAREGAPPTDFVLRENSAAFGWYTIDGLRIAFRTVDTLIYTVVFETFNERFDNEVWETYDAELRLSVRNNKMYLIGTLTWRTNNFDLEKVYDIELEWQGEGIPYVYYNW